jgi:hypothetical protein
MDYNKSNRGADGEKKASHRRRSAKVRTVGQRLARLRMNPAMIVRFAAALEITTDELLQPKAAQTPLAPQAQPARFAPPREDRAPAPASANILLKTIDGFLRGVAS